MSSLPPDDPDFEFLGCDRKKLLKEMKGTYDSKKNCWVPDAKLGYVKGEVQSTEGDKVTVKTEHGQTVTLKKDQIGQMNPPKFECLDDMANLTFLNDASVLGNLRARYARTLIYTFSGLFCIAINPYRRLPIYTMRVVQKWRHKKKTEVPPHLFTITEVAFQQMVTDRENQSILITGESGAGKTENTKKVIQYFAFVAAAGKGEPKENEVSLEDQIVQTNPVLEAYGNAKTVRNNNSSRFGKFIRIHFSPNGMIACADIEHYLLEKARVTAQGSIERNYHIFYQLNSSAYPDYHSKFLISGNSGDYAFINQGVLTVDGIDDVEEMKVTDNAFDVLGFSEDEKFSMYKITCAIMNFGEMRFKQKPRDEQAETDGTGEAEKTAQLLGINAADLLKALLTPKIKVGTETVVKAQTLPQVMYSVSAMSKSLFDKMFTWLVQRCNKTLETKERRQYFIGVLDIAGFEIFEFNSFEQLCINYTNERLQQFFNHHMFVLEQEIYKKEGIDWDFIDFGMDLAACIELIEKPMGILSMLEEECIVPKATDDTYKEKLYANHLGKNKTFGKPTKPSRDKSKESHFALFHYAGVVNYSVAGWLEKNKDPVNDNVVQLLQASKVPLIASVYEAPPEAAGGGKKKKGGAFQTISSTHRQSLGKLMTNLYTTQPHFVRCIIPNELKQPGMIDAALVLHQLQCNGVLEGIRICRKGFPTRLLYSDFKQRYSILAAYAIPSGFVDGKVVSDKILTALEVDKNDFRLGTTKLFFRAGVLAQLEDLRDERLSRIIAMLQSWIRGYMMRSEYKGLCDQRKGLSVIQRNIRTWVSIKGWKWWDLWCKIKPLLKSTQAADEMKIKEKEYIETKEAMKNMEAARKELEGANVDLLQAKNDCTLQLQAQEETIQEAQDRVVQLVKQRADFEHQMKDLEARLSDEEETASLLEDFKRKLEVESKTYRADIEERSQALAKAEEETKAKNHQIATLQGELSNQDGHLDKMSKEKKKMDEDNKKLHDDLVGEEDKANHLNKLKKKLEDALDELEDNLSREKKGRSDVEKVKRKLEQDLKATQETVDELDRIKRDLEESMKRKDVEINDISSRLEDEQGIIAQCQKKIRELQARVEELEEELEAERGARSKSEKQRAQLGRELDELAESLDEAGGATSAQIELNKKREGEILKLRNDYEEANVSHEAQISALRKKQQDAESELSEQVDQLQKNKSRVEKDKNALKGEIDDLQAQIDGVSKGKGNAEKMAKTLESKLNEASHQVDDANRSIAEINSRTTRTSQEVADLGVQLEDAESTIGSLSKQKAKLASDLEEVKRSFEDESRARMKLSTEVRNLQADIDTLRDQIEEEQESKSDLQRLLQKAQSDAQAWKSKFETGGGASAEEFEELKRRLGGRLAESESSLEAAQSKISSLEKIKYRLAGELEDLMVDVERANSNAGQLEKRQHQFDKSIDEWKHKARDIEAELEQSNREARGFSSEVFRLKAQLEESHDSINAVRRENKNLSEEIHELTEQLSEGGRSVHEVEKARKRLEIEREELQSALEEAEAALETEEAKVLRAQLELGQIRQEIDRRLAEKDEEFDNTRRNHQRSLESVQASLEAESKGRSDAIRSKKKLESDINELEVALDTANRVKIDAEKNVKKFQEQLRLISVQVEEETRNYQDAREQYQISERRNNMLASEAEELRTTVESAQRSYKLAESELHEANDRINELTSQNSSIAATRRKLESDIGSIATDLDDQATEIKNAEEKARKAAADAARLAEELRTEQEHSVHIEKMRKVLENQFRDLSVRLEEAEAASFKGGKRVLAKLESRVRELEAELDSEQRRHQEVLKNQRKSDRRLQELAFTADEDRKNQERLTDLIDKINGKIKTYKRQVEEAEEIAAVNLAKYRKVQTELEEAEERADQSEQSVAKLRAKNRSSVSMSRSGEESFSSSGTTTVIKRRTVVRTSSGIE